MSTSAQTLFRPYRIGSLDLPNRIVMAPMTRSFSPGGVPGANVAVYYRKRAEGGVGLIITEGIYPPHDRAGFDPKVPHLSGEAALAGWLHVTNEVHTAGARIFAQLWHTGTQLSGGQPPEGVAPAGASMPAMEIENVIAAFGEAASNAKAAGFDGIELHGAHGYLIDQFFWERRNHRTDQYGGSLLARTRFAADVITEVRRRVGPGFPIGLRFSQFKVEDYEARLAKTPAELDRFLTPLVSSGLDVLHASARRFWEPAFAGSDLTLAGWTKKLTGLPTIAVGCVTLSTDVMTTFGSEEPAVPTGVDDLMQRMEREEFDMIAVGRSLIANPTWPRIVQAGAWHDLRPFDRSLLTTLD